MIHIRRIFLWTFSNGFSRLLPSLHSRLSDGEDMKFDKRNEEIWRLAKEGAPFPEIAARFKLGEGHIKAICREWQYKIDNDHKLLPLEKLLPVRLQYALGRVFGGMAILGSPDKLAAMGYEAFRSWRGIGEKSIKQLVDALESLGYTISQRTTSPRHTLLTDPRCYFFLEIGEAILRDFFNYSRKIGMDDAECIPVMRVLIESITKKMKSHSIEEARCGDLTQELKTLSLLMFFEIRATQMRGKDPYALWEEVQAVQNAFESIYKQGSLPSGFLRN